MSASPSLSSYLKRRWRKLWKEMSLSEISGAFGDLGTFVPLLARLASLFALAAAHCLLNPQDHSDCMQMFVALLDSVPCLVMHFLAYRAEPLARSMLLVHSVCSFYLLAVLTSFATQSMKTTKQQYFLPQQEPFPWHLWIACPGFVGGNRS